MAESFKTSRNKMGGLEERVVTRRKPWRNRGDGGATMANRRMVVLTGVKRSTRWIRRRRASSRDGAVAPMASDGGGLAAAACGGGKWRR